MTGRRMRIGVAAMAIGLLSAAGAYGQDSPFLWWGSMSDLWRTGLIGEGGYSGGVCTSVVWDDGTGPALYVGGNFLSVGGEIGGDCVARWNGSSWVAVGGGIHTGSRGGLVQAMTVYNGELIVAGVFYGPHSPPIPTNNIARWDGTRWAALGGGLDVGYGSVQCLAVYNGELIAGGTFTKAGGVPVANIAKWNGTQWSALGGGTAPGANDVVVSLIVYDGALIAGGYFTTVGGVSASGIARWNGTQWSALGGGVTGGPYTGVNGLAVYSGALAAAGRFDHAGGVPANNIAMWNGANWSAMGSGIAYPGNSVQVKTLAVYDGELVAGGHFTEAGGVPAANIARWNGTEWLPLDGGLTCIYSDLNSCGFVFSLNVFNDQLVAGGENLFAGDWHRAWNIAKWSGSEWSLFDGRDTTVYAVAEYDGKLAVGGDLELSGTVGKGVAVNNYWYGTQYWDSPGAGVDGVVRALKPWNGDLIAGGDFTKAGDVEGANRIARWDGTAWSAMGLGMNAPVRALEIFGGQLVAGGAFTTAGTGNASRVARWDGAAWWSLGDGVDGDVNAMLVYRGELIAGGAMANGIARWDGANWQALGAGLNGPVYALTTYQGQLIAGGDFTTAGGSPAPYLARWDGAAWSPFGGELDGPVRALAVSGAVLAAGGDFTIADGVAAHHVAKWFDGAWRPIEAGVNGPVHAMGKANISSYGGFVVLVAGGHFTQPGQSVAYLHATESDADRDGDVDGVDFGYFASCFNGSGNPPPSPDCGWADLDHDNDVDGTDYGYFAACYNASGNPPPC